jgi:hypothetical protein
MDTQGGEVLSRTVWQTSLLMRLQRSRTKVRPYGRQGSTFVGKAPQPDFFNQ